MIGHTVIITSIDGLLTKGIVTHLDSACVIVRDLDLSKEGRVFIPIARVAEIRSEGLYSNEAKS